MHEITEAVDHDGRGHGFGGGIAAPASAARIQGANDAGFQASADRVTAELHSWARQNPALVGSTVGVDILVYVHAFHDRDTGEGKLTNQQALDQIKWLNYSFSGGQGGVTTRFDFVYRSYENIPLATRVVDVSGNPRGRLRLRSEDAEAHVG